MVTQVESSTYNETDASLLLSLQRGLPLVRRPFDSIGHELGLSEGEVLQRFQGFVSQGLVRRFGAIFESKGVGYESTLCAADIPDSELETMAARLQPHTGITHSYQREGRPTLWFTLTAPAESLKQELEAISLLLAPHPVWSLPARRTFKIGVVLDVNHRNRDVAKGPAKPTTRNISAPAAPLPEWERAIIRRMQADIPMSADLFEILARDLDMAADDLLAVLNDWKRRGILRRIALVPRHRNLGFKANAMCVWKVTDDHVEQAGQALAGSPLVTHCYERKVPEAFPYNLFAMVHAGTRDEALSVRSELSSLAGLSGGSMLFSTREFKKASPQFFV